MQGRIPLFFNIHQGQVDCLLGGHIIGKLDLGLYVLPDPPIQKIVKASKFLFNFLEDFVADQLFMKIDRKNVPI